jgi:Zn finger protein HypA/HybF involved in hydrogenase expression
MTEDPRHKAKLEILLGPAGPELTCEECFEHLDRYVELEVRGEDAERAVPGMRAHLQGCPACHDDHESLRALLEADGTER